MQAAVIFCHASFVGPEPASAVKALTVELLVKAR
jgi:hypothetical protein